MIKTIKIITLFLIVCLLISLSVSSSFFSEQQIFSPDTGNPSWENEKTADAGSDKIDDSEKAPIDIEAPTPPQGLHLSKAGMPSTWLEWNLSADNKGVTGYEIYKSEIRPENVNRIKNGGFETGLNDWKLIIQNPEAGSSKISSDSNERYCGNKSASIKTNSISKSSVANNPGVRLTQSGIGITAGKKYIIGFKIKSSVQRQASLEMTQDTKPYAPDGTWDEEDVLLTGGWQYIRRVFTAAETVENFRFSILLDGTSGIVWIDDVELYETSVTPYTLAATSPKEMFRFEGFEPANMYSFFVKARDAAGNTSSESNVLSVFAPGRFQGLNPIPASIKTDGETKDWKDLKPLATGVGKLRSLLATEDQGKLYILVQSAGIGRKNMIFIDKDNNSASGYSDNEVKGVEYCLDENDNLFMYTGDGVKPIWKYVRGVTSYRSKTTLEVGIDLMDLEMLEPGEMRISFWDWESHESLPAVKEGMALVDSMITGLEDDTAPSAPKKLYSPEHTIKTVTLFWGYSTDNVEVKGYVIYRNGIKIGTSPYGEFSDSGLSGDTKYQYSIRAYDAFGNMSRESNKIIVATNKSLSGNGAITREYWLGGDTPLYSLRSDSGSMKDPDGIDQSTSFAAPVQLSDNYCTRMRGYIRPTVSGSYTFYISSDDSSELWLSTDDKTANKRLLASVNGYSQPKEWSKYETQKSSAVTLEAGKKYYVEALHVEGYKGDHMEVGWMLPERDSITVIPGANLSPFF